MKISKKASKIAREIIQTCTEKGEISEIKLERFNNILSSSKEHLAVEVLLELGRILKTAQKNKTLLIESAFPIESSQAEKIKDSFEKQAGKDLDIETIIDKDLIAGVRITLGDNVWEHSTKGNLEKMKGMQNV